MYEKAGADFHSIENSTDSLKGRIIEISLADLIKDEEQSFRKIQLRVDEVSVAARPFVSS